MPLGNVVRETMVRSAPESNRTRGKTSTLFRCIVRTIAWLVERSRGEALNDEAGSLPDRFRIALTFFYSRGVYIIFVCLVSNTDIYHFATCVQSRRRRSWMMEHGTQVSVLVYILTVSESGFESYKAARRFARATLYSATIADGSADMVRCTAAPLQPRGDGMTNCTATQFVDK
jgi:hypothetical protein